MVWGGKMAKCPICGKPSIDEYKPFCSKRCADVDLGKWLNESYVVESEEAVPDDDQYDIEDN